MSSAFHGHQNLIDNCICITDTTVADGEDQRVAQYSSREYSLVNAEAGSIAVEKQICLLQGNKHTKDSEGSFLLVWCMDLWICSGNAYM